MADIGCTIHGGGGWIIRFKGDLITIQPSFLYNIPTQHVSLAKLKSIKRIQLGKQVKEHSNTIVILVIHATILIGIYVYWNYIY
jgi:hypothetical protein